jgi:hypothetical protein
MNIYASGIVSIGNRACKYAGCCTLPEGWNAIFRSLQYYVDMDIYPVAQGHFPSYILNAFAKMPNEKEEYGEIVKWVEEILRTKEKTPITVAKEIKKEMQEFISSPDIWQLGKNDLER